jgi:hypothetical protein
MFHQQLSSKCYFYYHFTTKIFQASFIYLIIYATIISLSAIRVGIMFGKLGVIFRTLYITKYPSQKIVPLLPNFISLRAILCAYKVQLKQYLNCCKKFVIWEVTKLGLLITQTFKGKDFPYAP